MSPRNSRTVFVSRIEQNMRLIRQSVPDGIKTMAVVKADGYGHGAVRTAEAALKGGADMLAVASASEGSELRRNGITAPVLVLGAVTEEDAYEGVEYGLIQTVCSPMMVCWCEQAGQKLHREARVHLKIDSGMGRIGVRTEAERDAVLHEIATCRKVQLAGVFTHFSDADGDADGILYTKEQFRRFLELTESIPDGILRHCCNSAAIHRFPEMCLDMVRAGISLYGYPPVETENGLKPCMQWSAKVSYVKEMLPGEYVSYGRTYRSERTIRVATITCGYGDGYFRSAGNKARVLINGKKVPVIGRICMDQMMADVTDIDVSAGDKVILIGESGGEQITAEDVAAWAGTISYEVLLNAGSRVSRIYDEITR